eukprot:PhM_4_TR2091/c2_g2_i5/m.35945
MSKRQTNHEDKDRKKVNKGLSTTRGRAEAADNLRSASDASVLALTSSPIRPPSSPGDGSSKTPQRSRNTNAPMTVLQMLAPTKNIKDFFVPEKCSSTEHRCQGNITDRHLCDEFGPVHLRCTVCENFISHSQFESNYRQHIKLLHSAPHQRSAPHPIAPSALSCDDFVSRVLPVLVARSSLNHFSAIKFLTTYERFRPSNFSESHVPKDAKTWKGLERRLAACTWDGIRAVLSKYRMFTLSVDGGSDKVLNRFMLILVMYVGPHRYLLPPIYKERGRAFDGEAMGGAILSSLYTHLGDEMLKLRVLMVDGCPVNAVAAAYVNDAFLEVQKRHEALGDVDWENIKQAFASSPKLHGKVTMMYCVGHFINVLCHHALKDFEKTEIFLLSQWFRKAFYCDDVSSRKGRYQERDIEDALGTVSEDVKQACSYLQMFSGDTYVAEHRIPSVVLLLQSSLKELAKFPQAVEIKKLLSSWTEDASPQDKHRTFLAVCRAIQEEAAVISTLRGPKSQAPKLGGATRWLVDKFECISYIRDHMFAIYNFVADELSRSKTMPCNSVHSMYSIMNSFLRFIQQGDSSSESQARHEWFF